MFKIACTKPGEETTDVTLSSSESSYEVPNDANYPWRDKQKMYGHMERLLTFESKEKAEKRCASLIRENPENKYCVIEIAD